MLHGDLGGIFLFFDGQSRQLTHGRRGHGAGRADLGLAAAFRAGDRGVVPDKVAEQTRHAERFGDLAVGQVVFLLHIHEHGGQHTAAAAGGRGDDGAVSGILLGMPIFDDNRDARAWYFLPIQEAAVTHTAAQSGACAPP